jgi:uncharacterized damage-inducible protein DinB
MTLEVIRSFHHYNEWAMERVLEQAEQISGPDFVAEDDTPWGSIRNQLVHLVNVHWSWLSWCDGSMSGEEAYALTLDFDDYQTLDRVRVKWEEVRGQTNAFLERATTDDMQRVLASEGDGYSFSLPTWQVMLHIANHSMQHRTEIAMSLTKLGRSPGNVDYIFFALEQASN